MSTEYESQPVIGKQFVDIICLPYIDGFVQDCSNSIANALELLQSCTKPYMTLLIWKQHETLWYRDHNIPGKLGKLYGSWWPASMCHQGISSHDILNVCNVDIIVLLGCA